MADFRVDPAAWLQQQCDQEVKKNKFLRALGECGVLDTGIIQTERHYGSVTIVCPVAKCTYANKLMGYLRDSKRALEQGR